MEPINIDKLDDIQLSVYLAQKNNETQSINYIIRDANVIYDWIKSKREETHEKDYTHNQGIL